MVEVILAGYNVDKNILDDYKHTLERVEKVLTSGIILDDELLVDVKKLIRQEPTPESISAAYARISRDPRVVTALRAETREELEKARKSNQVIVFGMSHHSVAEHAQFNFDVLGLSRLAVEELEARRIGSGYTEKSQRYITLDGDFVVPKEFKSGDKEKFLDLISTQNKFYFDNLQTIIDYHYEANPKLAKVAREKEAKGVSDKMNREKNILEGWGKEDTRYALSMATEAQIGTSFNARTLEHVIRVLRNSDLEETRDLAQQFYDVTKVVAPSLILLASPEEFEKQFNTPLKDDNNRYTKNNIKEAVAEIIDKYEIRTDNFHENFKIFDYVTLQKNDSIDVEVLTAMIHTGTSKNLCLEEAHNLATELIKDEVAAKNFFKKVLKDISEFDSLPREFEFSNLNYEVIISASNFAQMKRHRIMTLLPSDYDPNLGYTIPKSVRETNLGDDLSNVCVQSSELYDEFHKTHGRVAEYCLTNAHRRRVLISVNPRELYHISRMREDTHAQWDIRYTAHRMLDLAKDVAPLTFMLAAGKSYFKERRNQVYEK